MTPPKNQITDLIIYHAQSPNMDADGCLNTGLNEEGVEFRGFEPERGTRTFVGRTSIIEAAAVLFSLTPNQVVDRLTRANTRIQNLEAELAAHQDMLAERAEAWSQIKEIVDGYEPS